MKDMQITLSDGRTLAYAEMGEPNWPCVMFFHGAPASRLYPVYLEQEFLDAGIRVVSPERPGYGRSSPQPGRTLADWPADVVALADALGIDRFIVAGHSSGGPYAIACTAMLPERVSAAIVLDGVTDMGWPSAWDGYVESEARLMRQPDEAGAIALCSEQIGEDGGRFGSGASLEFSAPDEQLFEDERVANLLTVAHDEAFRQGVVGYAQDIFVQRLHWPFDSGSITTPVHVVHGDLDMIVPLAHSRHTAELIPGATLHILPEHGHLTTVNELPSLARSLA